MARWRRDDGEERIYEILEDLPDDVNFEDALYELYVASKFERGLEQADRGEGIPHQEAKRRLQLLYGVRKGLEESERREIVSHEEAKQMIDNLQKPLGESAKEETSMTIKDEIIQLMQELPEEATAEETIDEAMDRLYLLYRIQRGDRQIEEGKGIPHDEVLKRMAEWRK